MRYKSAVYAVPIANERSYRMTKEYLGGKFEPKISARRICDIAVRLMTDLPPVQTPKSEAELIMEDAIAKRAIAKAGAQLKNRAT